MNLGLQALSDTIVFSAPCPVCGNPKTYKNEEQLRKGIRRNKPCRSCANSISQGGTGALYLNGKRKCIDCHEFKSADYFYSSARSLCIECNAKRTKIYNKEKYRFLKYGITKEQFNEIFNIQNHKCPICTNDLLDTERIHIDHSYATGKVRGLLCSTCNKGLGLFRENQKSLQNAIKYLQNYE